MAENPSHRLCPPHFLLECRGVMPRKEPRPRKAGNEGGGPSIAWGPAPLAENSGNVATRGPCPTPLALEIEPQPEPKMGPYPQTPDPEPALRGAGEQGSFERSWLSVTGASVQRPRQAVGTRRCRDRALPLQPLRDVCPARVAAAGPSRAPAPLPPVGAAPSQCPPAVQGARGVGTPALRSRPPAGAAGRLLADALRPLALRR